MQISIFFGTEAHQTQFVDATPDLSFDQIGKFVCKSNWAPSTFHRLENVEIKNGKRRSGMHRVNVNFKETQLIALDVDGGCSLEEAKDLFKDYRAIFLTTRNHQKIKHKGTPKEKLPCDRFRVVIPLDRPITSEADYRATWSNAKELWPFIDESCSDPARFYFKSEAQVHAHDGKAFPVIETKKEKNNQDEDVKRNSDGKKGQLFQSTLDFIAFGAPDGRWHRQFFFATCDLREQGYSYEETVELLTKATLTFKGALDDEDIYQIKDVFQRQLKHPFREDSSPPQSKREPPQIHQDAFYGFAGDFVRLIEPHTEASSVALLTQFLVAFGNVIGRSAHFIAEADRHFMNLFVLVVGDTAKARKGTSWGHILRLFKAVQQIWRVASGLASGEGLIWHVRDPIEKPVKNPKTGETRLEIVDPGEEDKRLLVQEAEFASVLKIVPRDGNTLSAVIRNAWDTGELRSLSKNSPGIATGAHISIVAHITCEELRRYLSQTETANGFANRFLFIHSKRSKLLPEGGNINHIDFAPLIKRLDEIVRFAAKVKQIGLTPTAKKLWYKVYPKLSKGKPGLLGALTARSEAQVRRLACLYALLDCKLEVDVPHLKAALAIWDYCEASCKFIFGDSFGNPIADKILKALEIQPNGLTRTEIRDLFNRNEAKENLDSALNYLLENNLVSCKIEKTGGRPIEIWSKVKDQTTETTYTTNLSDESPPTNGTFKSSPSDNLWMGCSTHPF